MNTNIGAWERAIRFALGIVVMYAGFQFGVFWAWVGSIVGLEVMLTGVLGWSPLYWSLGTSTDKKKHITHHAM